MKFLTAILFCALALPVWANAPERSLRPDIRPGSGTGLVQTATASALRVSPLPTPRPGASVPVQTAEPEQPRVVLATAGAAVRVSLRPVKRPKPPRRSVVQASTARVVTTPVATSKAGSVCGDKTIRGQTLSSIPGRIRGCGIDKPVRITAVDGVRLTSPATVNCQTAKALKKWVKNSVKPSVGRLGGGVASLRVVAHYSCRTRNNIPGAKISEHGRGNAIDIAAINLKNGVALTVLKGWRDKVQSKPLRAMHKGACGIFGTVLGPNADRYHQDHFHLDVARHRGGAYCR